MARIRSIKPSFFRHEALFEAEQETGFPLRVAFAGLWTSADREGRFAWSPRALKLDCLPYDDVDFARVLDALVTRGFIMQYRVDGTLYGYIPTWKAHQVINNRESGSVLPIPSETNTLTREARVGHATGTRLCNYQGEGKGREGEVRKKDAAPDGAHSAQDQGRQDHPDKSTADDPWKHFFARGSEVLGPRAGGILTNLKKAKDGVLSHAMSALEMAAGTSDPKSYVMAIVNRSGANSMLENQYPPERDPRL